MGGSVTSLCFSVTVFLCFCFAVLSPPGGCTTKLAEQIRAFLANPGLLNTKLAIRDKRFHEAHLK